MNIKIDFFQNDLIQAIGAGIYEISIHKDHKSEVLYIGESVFVLVRCATHLYKLNKNPEYLGFTDETIRDSRVMLQFKLVEETDEKISRKKKELKLIRQKNPLSQSGISDYQKSVEDKISALTSFLNSSP